MKALLGAFKRKTLRSYENDIFLSNPNCSHILDKQFVFIKRMRAHAN